MTNEEIERAFQQVALSIQQLTQIAARTEERLDASDTARQDTGEKLDALINAQVRYEARQERMEEAFRQIAESHQALIGLLRIQEERIDGHDGAQQSTDARLDALIDAQIGFDERLARIAAAQAEHRKLAEERHARLDEKLVQLAAAQAKTEERIEELFNRNGQKQ